MDDETRREITATAVRYRHYLIALGDPTGAATLDRLVARALDLADGGTLVAYTAAVDQLLAFCRDHLPAPLTVKCEDLVYRLLRDPERGPDP